MVRVAAKVQDLHRNLAAFFMHRIRHHAVVFCLGLGGQHGAALHGATAFVGRNAAGHDQAHVAPRPLSVEGRHALEPVGHLFQAHVHGAHQYAVFQGGKAQIERLQHMGISGHGGPLCNWLHNSKRIPPTLQLVA